MATPLSVSSVFNTFLSLLLLHLGCFIFTNTTTHRHLETPPPSKKSKAIITSSWSYLKRIFSYKTCKSAIQTGPSTPARSSQHSGSTLNLIPPGSCPESDISTQHAFFPLRNDIFPCTFCGEIFQKQQLLENHQAIKHAVSELLEGDSGKNIVRIIFESGWSPNNNESKQPKINRILKIHNCSKILSRFEEYRESVKAKASARNGIVRRRNERCVADGNELLRFHCSTFLCDLGLDGNSSICSQQFCNICGIIKSGFSPKLDGISTLSRSWRAHSAVPEEMEEEFKFMNVKRAMLVCRVVAGRVGCDGDEEGLDKEDGGFDSIVGRSDHERGPRIKIDEEELLVFNPRAVLPCFVIVYTL